MTVELKIVFPLPAFASSQSKEQGSDFQFKKLELFSSQIPVPGCRLLRAVAKLTEGSGADSQSNIFRNKSLVAAVWNELFMLTMLS